MALLMAMKRATSSSTVFAKLLNPTHHLHHRSVVAPVARRLFSSNIPITDSDEDYSTINANGGSFTRSHDFPIQRGTCDQSMDNPFQISGPRGAYEAKKVDEGLFVRMEMPGIEKDDVKIWVEYGSVFVKGEGRKESRYEESGRAYSGSIELCSNVFHPEKIKADMRNGVLRMVIPKAKNNSEGRNGVFEVKIK